MKLYTCNRKKWDRFARTNSSERVSETRNHYNRLQRKLDVKLASRRDFRSGLRVGEVFKHMFCNLLFKPNGFLFTVYFAATNTMNRWFITHWIITCLFYSFFKQTSS